MQEGKNQNNNLSNPIHVIGTDASGPGSLPLPLQELILSTKTLAGPNRILENIRLL